LNDSSRHSLSEGEAMSNQQKTPHVYLAGRIRKERERFGIVDCTYDIDEGDLPMAESQFRPVRDRGAIYTGPFTISCDHGCAHSGDFGAVRFGTGNHGAGEACYGNPAGMLAEDANAIRKRDVHRNSMDGIAHADAVFAYIDDAECYGTLVEIGAAYAIGVPVFIGKPLSFFSGELWFAEQCAVEVFAGSLERCLKMFWHQMPLHIGMSTRLNTPGDQAEVRELIALRRKARCEAG